MGGPVDLFGGGVLTAIVLAALGALFVVVAIAAFAFWKRRSREEPAVPAPRNARLAVSEVAVVPGGRRLMLVRRDNVEHLILIGGPRDMVVEGNIVRQRAPAPGSRPAAPRPAQPQALRPAATAPSAAAPAATAVSSSAGGAQPSARGEAPAVDPALQERLRAASTALALRHAAAQPSQPVVKREAVHGPAPAGSAVAGLAAGVAALTAAAGSRARAAPEDDGKAAEPAAENSAPGKPAEAEAEGAGPEPDGAEPTASAGGKSAVEEPERAVFGLRSATPDPAPSSSGPEASDAETQAPWELPAAAIQEAPDSSAAERKSESETPRSTAKSTDAGASAARNPDAEAPPDATVTPEAGSVSGEAGKPEQRPTEAATPEQDVAEHAAAAAPPQQQESVSILAPATADKAAGQRPRSAAQPDSPAVQRPQPAPMSGFAPGRDTTLGDLAERLEEALIQQAATGASAEPAQPAAVTADEAMPPSPAPPQRDEASVAGHHPAEKDAAAVIDFSARRRPGNESLEEEMARLLGELTRDTTRR